MMERRFVYLISGLLTFWLPIHLPAWPPVIVYSLFLHLFFKVGVYSNCNATDKWSWTAKRSLKYKNQYCLKPQFLNPKDNTNLVLDSNCDRLHNYFQFVPSKYPQQTGAFLLFSTPCFDFNERRILEVLCTI